MINQLFHPIKRELIEILEKSSVSKFEIVATSTDDYPLFLFLTLNLNKVGFATLNGKPEEDYLKAFENFRKIYSDNSSEWAKYDLTLVLCITNKHLVSDEFCVEKEQDAYFCRKFVIDLKKELKSQLMQLSFIPLSPKAIGIKRPVSAQTFLMKHGVKSELAKFLAVPHARGIEGIIEECIRGNLGKPEWPETEVKYPQTLEDEKKGTEVRLKELEINNFRAYRGNHKFNLDADLIVLHGPNGLGKTSFFDAIDFVCTGGIARLDARAGFKGSRLINALKHLDASLEDSYIRAIISGNDDTSLQRYLKDRTKAYVNGYKADRSKTLIYLSGILEKPIDLRVENFVRLFRSTHLFGQEFQSLTSELKDNSRLPEDVVSRMLAFQDYVEAINKAGRVVKELKKRHSKEVSELDSIKFSLSSIENELIQLRRIAKKVEKPKTLEMYGRKLVDKIMHEMKLSVKTPKLFDQNVCRELRRKLEVPRANILKKLGKIEEVEEKFPKFLQIKKKLKEKENESVQKKKSYEGLNTLYTKKDEKCKRIEEELKQIMAEEGELFLKQENLNWLLNEKSEYEQMKDKIKQEGEYQKNTRKNLAELFPKIEQVRSEKERTEIDIVRLNSEIKTLEKKSNEVVDCEANVSNWSRKMDLQNKLEQKLSNIKLELESGKNSLQGKRDELGSFIDIGNNLKDRLGELQHSQSKLKTLLDNIEKYITNEVCPVCGTSHESRNTLIKKLRIQRGIKPKELQRVIKDYETHQVRIAEICKEIRDLEGKVKKTQREIERIQEELQFVNGEIKKIKDLSISLEIPLTRDAMMNIGSLKENLSKWIKSKEQELENKKAQVKKQQNTIEAITKQREDLEKKLRISESGKSQLNSMITIIKNDIKVKQLSLIEKKEGIQKDLEQVKNNLSKLRKQIRIKKNEFQNLRSECSELTKEINILRKQRQEINNHILELNRFINEMNFLIKQSNLDLDGEREQLVREKKLIELELARLDSLLEELLNFEVSLDEVQKSAALLKLQKDKEKINKSILNSEKELNKLYSWLSSFQDIKVNLQSVRNKALKEYTARYGPFASDIQKRMRSVYSFGDISLYPEKGEVVVQVERGVDKKYLPSDYFSASQMNIVALSIFLSAALTQTWSFFTPILLDDPVTHFDDLNVYSLIDIIRGLIMRDRPGKGRQFIISTCEQRLFQLIREKFNRLGSRVVYYIFESIGEKGPVIKKI